jgi:hypothetical protein
LSHRQRDYHGLNGKAIVAGRQLGGVARPAPPWVFGKMHQGLQNSFMVLRFTRKL